MAEYFEQKVLESAHRHAIKVFHNTLETLREKKASHEELWDTVITAIEASELTLAYFNAYISPHVPPPAPDDYTVQVVLVEIKMLTPSIDEALEEVHGILLPHYEHGPIHYEIMGKRQEQDDEEDFVH
jgi:hypothetical protein